MDITIQQTGGKFAAYFLAPHVAYVVNVEDMQGHPGMPCVMAVWIYRVPEHVEQDVMDRMLKETPDGFVNALQLVKACNQYGVATSVPIPREFAPVVQTDDFDQITAWVSRHGAEMIERLDTSV